MGSRPGFTLLEPGQTGLNFTNRLQTDAYATNAVAHNGAGLALGDVDGDGRPDVYLCSLEGGNQLYRNLGNWQFAAVETGVARCVGQISTGATLVDVEGDGDLDLLVNGIAAGTRLFLNDGQGHWTEVTDTQLSRRGSATSMALADIDGDGDLDLYCTHYIDVMYLADPSTRFSLVKRGDKWEVTKVNGESTRLPRWKDRFEALPDGKVRELAEYDGFYRNDGRGRFEPILFERGLFSDAEGVPVAPYRDWGLSVMFRDLNGDLAPDFYVCNDMPSPDRVWINTGKGTFRAMAAGALRHTSRSAMGIDFADLDRDGRDDFLVVDMLARNPRKRLTQLVRDSPDQMEGEAIREAPSFNRNTLFFGRADGTYAETALGSGLAASDWSWCPIFLDVDLDGFEDVLISNGFAFDVMDQDSNDQIRARRLTPAQQQRVRLFHPGWATENAAFRNRGDGTFGPAPREWGFHLESVSYGMALADLDGDGDLDVVVNNLNAPASVYRNDAPAARVLVRLRGQAPNTQGIGARIRLIGRSGTQSQEMISGGRYLSGDEAVRVFAADPDRWGPLHLEVTWRDGTVSRVNDVQANRSYEVFQTQTSPGPVATPLRPAPLFREVSDWLGHAHVDAPFDDLAVQAMLPRRLSRLGPGVAWSDLDGDGWEDLVIAGGRGGRTARYRNQQGQSFLSLAAAQPSTSDQGPVLVWPDGVGNRRVLVANSANGPEAGSSGGIGVQSGTNGVISQNLPMEGVSPGPLAAADLDGDGDLDVFVGGRFRPGRFPEPVSSTVYLNQAGKLVPDAGWSRVFGSVGLVSGATFTDLDGDGRPDLALALEWGGVRVYLNQGGAFADGTRAWGLGEFSGWWTSVATGDFDGDGRMDLVCGNWGRNSFYELFQPSPLRAYFGEWIGDGTLQVLEAWESQGSWLPIRDRTWLSRGMPLWTERFSTHRQFSEATVPELLGTASTKSGMVEARRLDSTVFLNRGTTFDVKPLPWGAQLSPIFAVCVADFDNDGREDVFAGQNFFGAFNDLSRDDGGLGLWLRGAGGGTFTAEDSTVSGLQVFGEQRGAAVADFNHDGRVDLVVSQNNAPTRLYLSQTPRRGLRVTLQGPAGNPEAIGALLRRMYPGDRQGPARMVLAGSGYWSQDAATQVLGGLESPIGLWIRWPGGRVETVALGKDQLDVRLTFDK